MSFKSGFESRERIAV